MMKYYRSQKRRVPYTPVANKKRAVAKKQQYRDYKKPAQVYRPTEIPVVRSGLGNKQFVKLVYSSKFTVGGAATGANATYQFNMNSLFDPDRTGVGHQPLGFDQLAALFEKYIVTQVDYKISLSNASSSQTAMYAICASDATTTTVNFAEQVEQGNARIGIMEPLSSVKIAGNVKNWIIHGQTFEEYMGDDRNEAVFTATPSDISVLNICTCDGTTGTGVTLAGLIELTYYAWLRGSVLTASS